MYKTIEEMREKFLRNAGYCDKKNNMPVVYKQDIDLSNVKLIGCHNIRPSDEKHSAYGVHCFKWDNRLNCFYDNPFRYIEKLKQYRFVLTPDYSMYFCMNPNVLKYNVFRKFWCGNFWQRHGLTVIPTAGWAGKDSFSYCFDGFEKGCIVGVSTLGTLTDFKANFLAGYFELLKQKSPSAILCYGKVHDEMQGTCKIINCLHEGEVKKQEAKLEQLYSTQYSLFNEKEIGL